MNETPEIDREVMEMSLRGIVHLLHLLPRAELEAYVEGVSRNNSMYDSVGPIFDPTEYRNTSHSGRREAARIQLEITRHLMEARQLIDQLKPVKSGGNDDNT